MDNSKIKYFEYFLNRLLAKSFKKDISNNDFSILKAQKLLFFTVAIDSSPDRSNLLLMNVFDNFVAMPYGHVESDIYNAMKQDQLSYYKIDVNGSSVKKNMLKSDIQTLDSEHLGAIDNAINLLFVENSNIVYESPFNLVEISHMYNSWKVNFQSAQKNGLNSQQINKEEIIKEEKYFRLNQLELF